MTSSRQAICPYCESSDYRRSHRSGLREHLASWVNIRPYRCCQCQERFWQIRDRFWDGSIVSLLLILISELF
jgi:hypothetical protein